MVFKEFESLLDATKAIKDGNVQYFGDSYLDDFYSRPCIYLLLEDRNNDHSEVVYVGQTKSLGKRLGEHYDDPLKRFDSFSYIFVTAELLDEMEEILISVFHPKYNKKGHSWFTRKMAKFARIKSISYMNKEHSISSKRVSMDTVIRILELDGNMALWLADSFQKKT